MTLLLVNPGSTNYTLSLDVHVGAAGAEELSFLSKRLEWALTQGPTSGTTILNDDPSPLEVVEMGAGTGGQREGAWQQWQMPQMQPR